MLRASAEKLDLNARTVGLKPSRQMFHVVNISRPCQVAAVPGIRGPDCHNKKRHPGVSKRTEQESHVTYRGRCMDGNCGGGCMLEVSALTVDQAKYSCIAGTMIHQSMSLAADQGRGDVLILYLYNKIQRTLHATGQMCRFTNGHQCQATTDLSFIQSTTQQTDSTTDTLIYYLGRRRRTLAGAPQSSTQRC